MESKNLHWRQSTFPLSCYPCLSVAATDLKLFLKFTGPGIILIQSRAPRLTDTFTAKDIAEVGELDPSAKEAIIEKIQR